MERLSNELEVPIYVLDMDANPVAWELFAITGTPSVIRYVGGREAERLVGGHTDDEWQQLLLRLKQAAGGE